VASTRRLATGDWRLTTGFNVIQISQRARSGVVAGILLAAFLFCNVAAPAEELTENQLKAAFLFNFAKFVEWPDGAFQGAESPLIIGIAGNDAFAAVVKETVQGKTVSGRPLVVRTVQSGADVKGCHLLFLSGTAPRLESESLTQARQLTILTVGNSQQFAEAGGMIGFFMQDSHVRFAINPGAAQHANLRVSSKLLSLAKLVNYTAPTAASLPAGMSFTNGRGGEGTK
jgi:hypothetical protein